MLANPGLSKAEGDGVCQFANILCADLPFERDEIKKAQHLRRCVPCYVLTQGSSLCSPTLGYQKRNPYGVRQSANILYRRSPLLGEGLGVRLSRSFTAGDGFFCAALCL